MPSPRPHPDARDHEQERNLRRLTVATTIITLIAMAFVCWWLYEGAGYFENEMSYAWSYGPRKSPRVALPPGTVPRDGRGYDVLEAAAHPLAISPATAATMIGANGHGYPGRRGLTLASPIIQAALYSNQCAFCHGVNGRGDVPVGHEYDPAPPDFHRVVPLRSDAALLDFISNGVATEEIDTFPHVGARWHAFRLYLDLQERQALVTYLRTKFGK